MIKAILIKPEAKKSLVLETERFPGMETGGVICGHYKDNYLVIESVSGPGPYAIQSEIEFIIDKQFMDDFLDNEYHKSNGLNIYIGEWHTHPQVNPMPSSQDIQSIYERSYEWKSGAITFLIIGFYEFKESRLKDQIIALHVDVNTDQIFRIPIIFV